MQNRGRRSRRRRTFTGSLRNVPLPLSSPYVDNLRTVYRPEAAVHSAPCPLCPLLSVIRGHASLWPKLLRFTIPSDNVTNPTSSTSPLGCRRRHCPPILTYIQVPLAIHSFVSFVSFAVCPPIARWTRIPSSSAMGFGHGSPPAFFRFASCPLFWAHFWNFRSRAAALFFLREYIVLVAFTPSRNGMRIVP